MLTVIGNQEHPTDPTDIIAVPNTNSYKMAILRATLMHSYPLESIDKNTRVAAIADLIKEIEDTVTPYFVWNPHNNTSLIYQIFKGSKAIVLANTAPLDQLGTDREVKDYCAAYIMDGVYKSVYGTYPPGNAEAIHGILNDEKIAPLTKNELHAVYAKLRKHTDKPLLIVADIENLKKILPHPRIQTIPEISSRPEERTTFCMQTTENPAVIIIAFIVGCANLLWQFNLEKDSSFKNVDSVISKTVGSFVIGSFAGFVFSAAFSAAFSTAFSSCIKNPGGASDMESSIDTGLHLEVRFGDFIARESRGASSSGYVDAANSRRREILHL